MEMLGKIRRMHVRDKIPQFNGRVMYALCRYGSGG